MESEDKHVKLRNFEESIKLTAKHEIYYLITGEDTIQDPDDPTFHDKVLEIANQAIQDNCFIDKDGIKHTLFWNSSTWFALARDRLERFKKEWRD